jgi:hypothetical protein
MFSPMDEDRQPRASRSERFRAQSSEEEAQIRDWLTGRGSTVVTVAFFLLVLGTVYFMVWG